MVQPSRNFVCFDKNNYLFWASGIIRKIIFNIIKEIKGFISETEDENTKRISISQKKWNLDNPEEMAYILGVEEFIENRNITKTEDVINKFLSITHVHLIDTARNIFTLKNLIISCTNNHEFVKTKILKKVFKECRKLIE